MPIINMIIVGMTACGKTHYLVQELKTTFFSSI
jgi:uncharacterized protein involved in cysteine biosynthesis